MHPWAVFCWVGWFTASNPAQKDPLCFSEPVYAFIQRGYDFDKLYQVLFIRPAKWVSEKFTSLWLDKGAIDGTLHTIGRGMLKVGSVFRKDLDGPIINGGADRTGKGIQNSGAEIRKIQTGQVQQYMVMSVLAASVVLAVILVLFV